MDRLIVTLGDRSYPITISAGLFKDQSLILPLILPLKANDQAMLVTNETIAPLYLDPISQILEQIGVKSDSIILPDGEQYKTLSVLESIFTALLRKSHGRNTTLIALGGGVIGDLTGFAAATYQRGVRFIQIPTTLMAQVDSAIGGKTAVNHHLGKNMIGAFYQPISVVIDLDYLKTLPKRELSSGMAEIIKYGIILDEKFFCWLEKNMDALLDLDIDAMAYCIRRCCEMKAKIVTSDEYEADNLRSLLNLGHTFGHAIEAEIGYGNWKHGEAVSVGIVLASQISERLGQFTAEDTHRIITLLSRASLPVKKPKEMSAEKYLPHIMRDKKVLSGNIRLVLPIAIGKSELRDGISSDIVLEVLSNSKKS